MRFAFGRLLCGVVLLAAADARAHDDGIDGYSGKSGTVCNQCHSGGATPTVSLSGPTSLPAGGSGTYTLTIAGGAAVAGGLDAALDDASIAAGAHLATVSPSTKLMSGEVTHATPVKFSSGGLSFQFSVVAPAAARTMTLYAAGNSTNGNDSDSGDKAAATTMSIAVSGNVPPGADLASATNPPATASDLAIAPTPSGRDLTTPAGDPGSAGPPAGGPSSATMAQGGCALAPAGDGDAGALGWLLAFGLGALGVGAARVSRRARRASASPAPSAASASSPARARR
ncbi:MAG TPA: choice-of-anchor V domain-containing protein [Polyangia bacterium]|jgi:hypothetical protein